MLSVSLTPKVSLFQYIHLLGVLVKVTLLVMAAEVRKHITGMSPCPHRSLQRSCPGGRDLGCI